MAFVLFLVVILILTVAISVIILCDNNLRYTRRNGQILYVLQDETREYFKHLLNILEQLHEIDTDKKQKKFFSLLRMCKTKEQIDRVFDCWEVSDFIKRKQLLLECTESEEQRHSCVLSSESEDEYGSAVSEFLKEKECAV